MLLTADCVLLLERIRVFNRAYDLSVCVVLVDGWLLSVFVVTSCAAATAATTAHTPYRHHFDINLVLMCVWRSLPALHWSRMTGHMMPYYMNKLCVFNERWFSWTWMEFIRYSVWRMHGPNNQKLKRIRWNMRKKKRWMDSCEQTMVVWNQWSGVTWCCCSKSALFVVFFVICSNITWLQIH